MEGKFTLTCLEKYIPFAILDLNVCLAALSWGWGRTWQAACSPQAYGLGRCLSWKSRFSSFPSGLTLPASTVVSVTSGNPSSPGNPSRRAFPQSDLGSSFISISQLCIGCGSLNQWRHQCQPSLTTAENLSPPSLSPTGTLSRPYRPCVLLISSPPFSNTPFSSSVLPATLDCTNHS